MTKYSIVEFEDGIQMVPTSWLQIVDDLCLWPNYTNQIKINKAIAQLEEPSLTWSKQRVLRTFGTAKTHEEGMTKLKLAEKLSDVDTAASDEEKLSGKRGRHLRAKRVMLSSDDDDDMAAPPPKKKLPPFPKAPKNFALSNSEAIRRPAKKRDEGHSVANSGDERRQKNSFPAEEYSVTERDEGHFVNDTENEWTNQTTESPLTQNVDTIGSRRLLQKGSRSLTDNTLLEAITTNSGQLAQKNTPRPDIVVTPIQSPFSHKSRVAPRESSRHSLIQQIDGPSQETELPLDILKEILKRIVRMSYRLRDIEDKLDDKKGKSIIFTEDDDETWKQEDHDFPLKTQEALEKFEVALKNKPYASKMVEFMKTIGGSSANTCVVNILKYTVSDLVAKEYSWSGARKKKSFEILNTCRMLIKAVRSVFSTVTNDDIKGVVSKWLAQAKLRYTRKTDKSERAAEKKLNEEEEDASDDD